MQLVYNVSLMLLLCCTTCIGESRYFLCGPDEDGCSPDYYASCFCIPVDASETIQPYCLDFDKLACIPITQTLSCAKANIFKDQSACLATAFQSEPEPPCKMTSKTFCSQHHIPTCTKEGGINSCIAQ